VEQGRYGGGGDRGSDLINEQYKAIHNCHNKSPLYKEYILIEMEKKEKRSYIQISCGKFAQESLRRVCRKMISW
jgi:hypothetical protein